jgi:predicted protein tyrosine phosphatase
MAHGTQGTQRVYTGSGLQKVKPYVQFLVRIVGEIDGEGTSKGALARLILAYGQGQWTQSPGRLR